MYRLDAQKIEMLNAQFDAQMHEKIQDKIKLIMEQGQLPTIVSTMMKAAAFCGYPLKEDRIVEVKAVMVVAMEMAERFHWQVIGDILMIGVTEESQLGLADDYYSLTSPANRKDFWGSQWKEACMLLSALIDDITHDINLDKPTKEELKASSVMHIPMFTESNLSKLHEFIEQPV